MKKVEIIPIAQQKAKRKGIQKEEIEDAVVNPAQIVDGYGGRKVAHKKFFRDSKEYLLRFVYEGRNGRELHRCDSLYYFANRSLWEGGGLNEDRI